MGFLDGLRALLTGQSAGRTEATAGLTPGGGRSSSAVADFGGPGIRIEPRDIEAAARDLAVEPAVVRAVITVETGGASGFLLDGTGRPRILFEAHQFSRLTNRLYDESHPRISSRTWNRQLYVGGAGEYDRLRQAIALDRVAALKSASWGLFQVMGFNHPSCGFLSVEPFVQAMREDEDNHLEAFVSFCRINGLVPFLQAKNWAGFAMRYNGAGYAANRYDEKLAAAYYREIGVRAPGVIGTRGSDVRRLQEALNAQGARLVMDGIFGRATELAVEAFQERAGLPITGANDNATRRALGVAA